MKAKCLFIGATKYNYKEGNPSPVKYSLLSLMSHVVDIADVEVIDFEMLFGYPRSLNEIENFKEFVKKVLKQKNPDVVAISCYTSFDYLATIDILEICRYLYPEAILVVGGYHPTAIPEDFMGNNSSVDYIIRGEGEEALREIINNSGKNMPKVILGKNLDLSMEKPLRYDLYPYKADELYISLSRGCFHKCAFCVQSDDYINKYRKMDVERIKEKIDRASQYFPIKRLLFSDPIFGIDLEQTELLVEFLKEKYPHYSYWAETRIDRLTEELIACLSQLKIDLHFGVESLAEDTLLNLMEKTRNPQHYNESFYKAVELCQKYSVLGLFGFIMNYPGEQAESSQYTLNQIRNVIQKYDEINVTFHINQYALYPGNKIYNMRHQLSEERGFFFPNDGWWRSKEPNIRQRSEACIASASLKETYNGNIHYWHEEKNDLLRRYVSKYNFNAYQFYQRHEIRSVINAYNTTLSRRDDYDKIHAIIAQSRHSLCKFLLLYNQEIENNKSKKFIDSINKLFIYVTSDFDNQLIKAYLENEEKEEINRRIVDFEDLLSKEFKYNAEVLSKVQDEYSMIFLKTEYQIDRDGNIRKRK